LLKTELMLKKGGTDGNKTMCFRLSGLNYDPEILFYSPTVGTDMEANDPLRKRRHDRLRKPSAIFVILVVLVSLYRCGFKSILDCLSLL